jgi:hypothetical protein
MGQDRNYLGVATHLGRVDTEGYVDLEPKDITCFQVASDVGLARHSGRLEGPVAAKIRGRASWSGTHSFGKCGRIGLRVLKEKQYGSNPCLSVDDHAALKFLADLATSLPARSVQVVGARRPPVILYTDASYEEASGIAPKLGWVLFDPADKDFIPIGQELQLEWSVVERWIQRQQQIFAAEAFAPTDALRNLGRYIRGRDVVLFIDNEAAASTLIQGASSQDDVAAIAECFQIGLLTLGARCWIEWIDSASNPSDGLSRDGICDEWIAQQGWRLSVAAMSPWGEYLSQPRAAWQAFSKGLSKVLA